MIVAGEVSGDEHAAPVLAKLKALDPDLEFFGMGGSKLRASGLEVVVDSESHASVMGLTELFGSLRNIYAAFNKLLAAADQRKPHLAILLDFPDFNLRLADKLHRRGVKVLYYISPQVWAWRKGRVKHIGRVIDKVAAIFPFEEAFYARKGVNCEFVGHPFLEQQKLTLDRESYLRSIGLDPELPVVALLPGSRKAELNNLLPPMLEAFSKLRAGRPGVQALIPVAPTLSLSEVQQSLANYPGAVAVAGQAEAVLNCADAAVIASGTATIQGALQGVPHLVVYKLSPFSYRMARLLVRGVEHFAMVNLVAGRKIVEELLQEEASADRISEELERLLGDAKKRLQLKAQLSQVCERLQVKGDEERGASDRVAQIALEMLNQGAGRKKQFVRSPAAERARRAAA